MEHWKSCASFRGEPCDCGTDFKLSDRAERAHNAFCKVAHAYLPLQTPLWSELPLILKEAWKAAAAVE